MTNFISTCFRNVIIKTENTTGCYLNTTEIWSHFNFSQHPVIGMLKLICVKPVRVYMLPYSGPVFDVISYLQIGDMQAAEKDNCETTITDWNHFSAATDLRVLNLLDNKWPENCDNCSVTKCPNIKHIGTLYWRNQGDSSKNQLLDQLSCEPFYLKAAEVMFENFSMSEFPVEFESMFPNLQTLELPNNNFILPPASFPWTNTSYHLPRNMSRSKYMQDHYSKHFYLNSPANTYRRLLNLNFNKIHNLTDYKFHGHLQLIFLRGNMMSAIGPNLFENVTDLQNIDLSHNYLQNLPKTLFRKLWQLHKLDLSHNKIRNISVGLFDDLKALQLLNVGYNHLTSLPFGLFTKLGSLTVLHLESNQLKCLNLFAFPIDSTALQEIYAKDNPITEFPEFIFYLRGLSIADLENTTITLANLTAFIKALDKYRLIISIIDSASDSNFDDLTQRAQHLRDINLSRCKVQSLYLEEISEDMQETLILLLQHFRFILTENPLLCDCKIIPFANFVRGLRDNGTVAAEEYYFHEWLCKSPQELWNQPVLAVKDELTKCPVRNLSGCPSECTCFRRSVSGNIIVDCSYQNLEALHDKMPEGKLELIYEKNNISHLTSYQYWKNVLKLDVSCNTIIDIDYNVFEIAVNLRELYLNANLLSYLPESISRLNSETVTLRKNPFICDCKSLWMKSWIKENKHVINEWDKLSCSNKATGKKIIDVEDSDFICPKLNNNDNKYLVPSVTCSVMVLLFGIVGAIVYTFRLECKVLMYVYFGFHPFDKRDDKVDENFDCVIVHSKAATDWVMKNIVQQLEHESNGFKVCDMDRDFVVGFSFQENLTRRVQQSKRIMFCLTSDWNSSDDDFKLAWIIAEQKIKETKSNFGIIVGHTIASNNIIDKKLLRFIKRERFIDSSQRLFAEKVIYSMPRKRARQNQINQTANQHDTTGAIPYFPKSLSWNESSACVEASEHQNFCHAFIAYSNEDIGYIIKEMQPLLESKGYQLCIADRDFIPGASKEENILSAIKFSKRTIFILSNTHVLDEWSLFTFRTAYEKSLRERSNHLIVVIKDEVAADKLDKEVRQYLSSYVSLNANDRWFEQKLFNGLPLLKNHERLHSSPLFGVEVEQIEVDVVTPKPVLVNHTQIRTDIETKL